MNSRSATLIAAPHVARDRPALDIPRLLFLLGVLTASSDLFMAWNVGGFTLRAHQLLMVVPFAYAVGVGFFGKKIELPLGGLALYAWLIFIFAFIPNTVFISRSLGYAAWLLIDVTAIFLAVQLFDDFKWLQVLLRWYVIAFLFISIVGLAQLVLGLGHLPAPYVRQWLIYRMWPRLNGFSYEPSYFATYMLMGWVFCAWMVEKGSYLVSEKLVRITLITSTLAIILSTSRIGWTLMSVWVFGYAIRRVMSWRTVTFRLGNWVLVLNIVMLTFAGLGAAALYKSDRLIGFFASGTGLFGTAAHSVEDRKNRMWETFELFKKSPLVGYSLGGIAPAIREQNHQTAIRSNLDLKAYEGSSVFVEVLAASGIIGFLPFVGYILILIIKPSLLALARPEPVRTTLLGLVWALVMELLALQFNQNILRPYLWFHIAILSAAYATIRSARVSGSGAVAARFS